MNRAGQIGEADGGRRVGIVVWIKFEICRTVCCKVKRISAKMAGPVRQPIDIKNLERYISENVPEISIPLSIKQVNIANTRSG